jgi:hypothetical protein
VVTITSFQTKLAMVVNTRSKEPLRESQQEGGALNPLVGSRNRASKDGQSGTSNRSTRTYCILGGTNVIDLYRYDDSHEAKQGINLSNAPRKTQTSGSGGSAL